ncbi:hypothetical protein BpHYR1_044622 [Brachionus plicatilis]|uniref:Uncharacterized protein n=1 Tax=Brachionus plicatilis TaxID=10195 RepID=A0A3M7RV39_BRAPC|nr:hypothetical protein BpHYR1_044622 [Brachionus plicatilis]
MQNEENYITTSKYLKTNENPIERLTVDEYETPAFMMNLGTQICDTIHIDKDLTSDLNNILQSQSNEQSRND